MGDGKPTDEAIEIIYHKNVHDGIYYCVKYINKQSKEQIITWKKSEDLTCTDAIFEYWKSPHQFSEEIPIEENPISQNGDMKETIKILGISSINDQLVFLVRFPGEDRDKLVKSKNLIQNYKNEVIDFYRSHAKFA